MGCDCDGVRVLRLAPYLYVHVGFTFGRAVRWIANSFWEIFNSADLVLLWDSLTGINSASKYLDKWSGLAVLCLPF